MNLNKHIWEGWTVQDFINELEEFRPENQNFTSREEIKKWCMSYQPYYKKYIKEVVDYFCKKFNIK